jgi:LemA protein
MGKLGLGCLVLLIGLVVIVGLTFASTNNRLVTLGQDVDKQWAEVENQYQRRADLVPNLVQTVQGAANFEKETLTAVTNARASVGRATVNPGKAPTDPAELARFQAAQDQLGAALQRLLVVSENYPELKANASFRDLQAQLEGTENRIAVARNRYIKSVEQYNVTVRQFPANLTAMAFGYKPKANFTVENEREISKAPKVDFGGQKQK